VARARVIPDRQVIGLLKYLWDSLRTDPVLCQHMDLVCSSTLMRSPVTLRPTMDDVPRADIHAIGMPYIAVVRTGGNSNRRVNASHHTADLELWWLDRQPGGGLSRDEVPHIGDPDTWGLAKANLVYHRIFTLLIEMPSATYETAGLDTVDPRNYEIINTDGFCGFKSTVRITHTQPLWELPPDIDLEAIALTIKLYDINTEPPTDVGLEVSQNV